MISSASGWRRRKIHRFHVFRRFRRPHRWPVKTTQPNSVVETSGNSSDFSGSNRPSNSLTSQTTKHSSSQHFGKTFSRQIRSMNQNISQLQFMAEYLNIYFTHTHTHTLWYAHLLTFHHQWGNNKQLHPCKNIHNK